MLIRFNTDLCIKSLHVSCAASDMKCNPDERSAIVTAGSVLTEPHCGREWLDRGGLWTLLPSWNKTVQTTTKGSVRDENKHADD